MNGKTDAIEERGYTVDAGGTVDAIWGRGKVTVTPIDFPDFDSFATSIFLQNFRDSLNGLRGKLLGISHELQHPNDPPPPVPGDDTDIRETILFLIKDCNRIESDIRRELLARGAI